MRTKIEDPHSSAVKGIKVLFNRMLRILCGTVKQDRVSVKRMLEQLGWLSINQVAAEIRLTEVWKALNLNNGLTDLFEKVQGSTRAATPNRIQLKGQNSKLKENSFLYPSVKLWNMAPLTIVMTKTESNARKAIRSFAKSLPL